MYSILRKPFFALFPLFIFVTTNIFAQIISPDTVCPNTPVSFSTPAEGTAYTWVWDTVNVNAPAPASAVSYSGSPLSTPTFACLANDNGNYYGFTTNYFTNEVIRLSYGSSPTGTPTALSLGAFGMSSGVTEGIDVVKDVATGNWYGLVASGSQMLRLSFGTSLSNTPVATLWTYSSNLYWPHQLSVRKYGTQWIAFVANRNGGMSRFDFGTSLANTPTATNLSTTNVTNPCNFALYQQSGNWYMIVCNLIDATLTRLDLGTNIQNNSPTATLIGNPSNQLVLPRGLVLLADCNQLYGYIVNETGGMFKLDFQNSITNTPTITSLGTYYNTLNSLYPYVYNNQLNFLLTSYGNNAVYNVNLLTLPAGTVNNYYSSSTTHSFAAPGLYNITLYVDQGYNAGPAAFCKQVYVGMGVNTFLGPDTTLCQGSSLVLNAGTTGATGYTWSTGATTSSITVTGSGTYWVHLTGSACASGDTINVQFSAPPSVSLGADKTPCQGDTVTLQPQQTPANATYLWSTGAATSSINVTTSGTYWLKVTSGNCSATDTVVVQYKPAPIVNLGNDTIVCSGNALTLGGIALPGYQYLWNNNSTASSIQVTQAGTYWLQAQLNGCSAADTVQVQVLPAPAVKLGNDTTICSGNAVTLMPVSQPVPGVSYIWSTGATTSSITVSSTGYYWLTASNAACAASDSVYISVLPSPAVNLGPDQKICPGASVVLDATSPNCTYTWSNGSHQASVTVSNTGTYWVRVATSYNCVTTDTITIGRKYEPTIYLGPDTTLCNEDFIILPKYADSAAYLWSDGSTGSTLKVTAAGWYSLIATNECGTVKDSVYIGYKFCGIWFPNAFTPNGDGLNDEIGVLGNVSALKNFELSIYNRWGQRVFYTADPHGAWNGRFNGVDQPLGTFAYMFEYDVNGQHFLQKGNFHLIR